MKVVAQTNNKLTLKHKPIKYWLFGSLIITISLFFISYVLFYTPIYMNLNCIRSEASKINCELNQSYIFSRESEKQRFFDPQQANLVQASHGKGGITYQVVISTSSNEISLFKPDNFQQSESIASQINTFITTQQSNLFISHSYWNNILFYFLFVILLGLFGVYLITSPVVTYNFNKSLNQVIIKRMGLRGYRVIKYSLDDIFDVYTQEEQNRYGKLYRPTIAFRTQNFDKPLLHEPLPNNYTNKNQAVNFVYGIKKFLYHVKKSK